MKDKDTVNYDWINIMKGMAIVGVILQHWFSNIEYYPNDSLIYTISFRVSALGGTLVQLFFFLSGYGLYSSYKRKGVASWADWAKRRFIRVMIPYWIIVVISFTAMNILQISGPYKTEGHHSLMTLFSYLLLFRNMYPPSWSLNPSFWYIPVQVGLYLIFPLLIYLLNRYGKTYMAIMSFVFTYASITIFVILYLKVGENFDWFMFGHQNDWFMFFVFQFTLGMVAADYFNMHSLTMVHRYRIQLLITAVLFFSISFLMKHYWPFGRFYNDLFTLIGGILLVSAVSDFLARNIKQLSDIFSKLGNYSFELYLLHFPLILIFVKFAPDHVYNFVSNPLFVLISGLLFCLCIMPIAVLYSKFIKVLIYDNLLK